MTGAIASLAVLILVFLLVMFLGMQIQITGLSRKLDEIIDKLNE